MAAAVWDVEVLLEDEELEEEAAATCREGAPLRLRDCPQQIAVLAVSAASNMVSAIAGRIFMVPLVLLQ